MSQPFVGEIRMVGFSFAPVGWAFCDGSLIPIAENEALFSLIGTTYGGDGQSTFALPDLRSRVPIHMGNGYIQGQRGGVETVTLTVQQLPAHNHTAIGNVGGTHTGNSPANNTWVNWAQNQYTNTAPTALMAATALAPSGGSQPHDNMLPYLAINFVISLFGIFPTQN